MVARVQVTHGLRPRALDRAHAYIETHIGERFTLADLAGAACVSRFHFSRLFRTSTGMSPMDYVLKLRIELAQGMLMAEERKISAMAAELGFFDQSHFTRSFRRVTGMSPREFARRH
jgi:AraC family transcriptional regulator